MTSLQGTHRKFLKRSAGSRLPSGVRVLALRPRGRDARAGSGHIRSQPCTVQMEMLYFLKYPYSVSVNLLVMRLVMYNIMVVRVFLRARKTIARNAYITHTSIRIPLL